MPALTNFDDPRYLTELAFKNIITQIGGFSNVYITADTTTHTHPCVLVRVTTNEEEIAPGTGIFKQRVELELMQKLDKQTTEQSEQQIRSLRQCLYRNDTDPRPMRDLANRLSVAVTQPYTCLGVVPVDEPSVAQDAEVRIYSYKLTFDVHVTPTE